jgi:hypothetical protein
MDISSKDTHEMGRQFSVVVSINRPDTVGQPPSTEVSVPNMLPLKAKKLSKRPREKVLLEL